MSTSRKDSIQQVENSPPHTEVSTDDGVLEAPLSAKGTGQVGNPTPGGTDNSQTGVARSANRHERSNMLYAAITSMTSISLSEEKICEHCGTSYRVYKQ